jgi:hypothetical protein
VKRRPLAAPRNDDRHPTLTSAIQNFDRNTYRAVYTVRFEGVVYALHVFQKKSKLFHLSLPRSPLLPKIPRRPRVVPRLCFVSGAAIRRATRKN